MINKLTPKIFSLPLNPLMNARDLEDVYLPFVQANKQTIFDIYCTVRIPPFTQDAMGSHFDSDSTNNQIDTLFRVQELTGVMMTAAFNNINVIADLKNLEIFVNSLKPLYERGLRSIIIPHQHWMRTGILQEEFPDMFIKNTIVSALYDLQDIYEAAIAGFDYIHLDRNVIRDKDTLDQLPLLREKIKERTGKDIMLSLLANEGCLGRCPLQKEHYNFNLTRTTEKSYFTNRMSAISCTKWKNDDPSYFLKLANIPPLKSEYDYYLNYFDTIKLHGRDSMLVLEDTMAIIDNYNSGNEELFEPHIWHYKTKLGKNYNKFIKDISKNCKFQCWKCSWCDDNII